MALRRPGERLALRPAGPHRAELEPTLVGWQAHARPFGFEPELDYADGVAALPHRHAERAGALRGDGRLRRDRGDRRRPDPRELVRQTTLLIELLDEAGFEVGSPRDPARRGGTVTVLVPEFEAVHKELGERGILCDFRPDVGLRLGPHFYNTDDELRHTVQQIGEIVETGAHERHLGATARF